MKIFNEDLYENLDVTEAQFNELYYRSIITKEGYWLEDDAAWIILAIGLDMTPGGLDVVFSKEAMLQ